MKGGESRTVYSLEKGHTLKFQRPMVTESDPNKSYQILRGDVNLRPHKRGEGGGHFTTVLPAVLIRQP